MQLDWQHSTTTVPYTVRQQCLLTQMILSGHFSNEASKLYLNYLGKTNLSHGIQPLDYIICVPEVETSCLK